MSNEYEQDAALLELNQKFAHVHIDPNEATLNISDDLVREYVLNLSAVENLLPSLHAIRSYLSKDVSVQRIQNVLDAGILGVVNILLPQTGDPEIQHEAAWIVTNLAFGTTEQTKRLLEANTVDYLLQGFRHSKSVKIRSQMAWAIANISIDAEFYRPVLAGLNFIEHLATALLFKLSKINPLLVSQQAELQLLPLGADFDDVKALTWSLATLCHGGFNTSDYWSQYIIAFDAFGSAMFLDNAPLWVEACWGLSRVLSNNDKNPSFFNHLAPQDSLCRRLICMLGTKSERQVLPILQTIYSFSTGPLTYTLLEANLLNSLWWFCSPDISHLLRHNALRTISNLASGEPQVISQLVDNENVMRTLLYHLSVPGHDYKEAGEWILGEDLRSGSFVDESRVMEEALLVYINIMTFAADDCISTLLDSYKEINPSLVHILHFRLMNTGVLVGIIKLLILIIRRTYRMMSMSHYNPYINEMMGEGIMVALSYHFHSNTDPTLQSRIQLLRQSIEMNGANLANDDTDMPEPNPRRIVEGKNDGDIRFIEEAMNSMEL